MAKRFASSTLEDIIEAKRRKVNAEAMMKCNQHAASCLRDYLTEKNQPANFETFDAVRMDEVSGHFYIDARKITIMSSTSQKHRNFVSEPMGDKPVTDLAGIGKVLGERMEEKGFDKAYVVLGQYLLLKKNEELFIDWVKDICNANNKQGGDCHTCLKEWTDAFL